MKLRYLPIATLLLLSCGSEPEFKESKEDPEDHSPIETTEEEIEEEPNYDHLKFMTEMSQEEALEYEPVFFYDKNGLEQGHAIYRLGDFVDDPENPNEVVAEEHWIDGEIVKALYLDSTFFAFD